ncbi:dual oxidase maturation factor 1-like isoform X2 [Ruditapes philippinarum]|uniref:dual oxidase maturation factor 1-like isoform X2 n=1 Tax=Ruditapes philippinarum TaxID=129788 RepID=UPI00295ACEA9|nr:dual oxidase maturation factor 1-like isoform X2 [Ruditapes philippinarum]
MAYQAFRENGAPTWYDANPTAWQADILESGLIFAFVILAVSFFVILPGIRGKEKIFTFIRVTLSLYIGAVIILTNWTYTWETAQIHTRTKYKAGTGHEIEAEIGVHMGLRGINITLKGTPEKQLNETINYNEHFSWEWEQGRLGFGPFAGRFNREYREAQFRGLPLPILWIAEYFTFDGEGIRWGRHYRQAGWYSHILMWLCFPLWVLTNILFFVLLSYGANFLMLTGTCMIVANIIWATLRNPLELKIPWEDGIMEFSYGGSFYITLITGIFCVVSGIVIRLLDLRFPNALTTFFGVDVLQDANEVLDADTDDAATSNKGREMHEMDGEPSTSNAGRPKPGEPMRPPAHAQALETSIEEEEEGDDEELYMAPAPSPPIQNKYVKRKSRGLTIFQKSRRRRAPPPTPQDEPDEMYVNTGRKSYRGDKNCDYTAVSSFNGATPDDVSIRMN